MPGLRRRAFARDPLNLAGIALCGAAARSPKQDQTVTEKSMQ